jgi:hypothetical protein
MQVRETAAPRRVTRRTPVARSEAADGEVAEDQAEEEGQVSFPRFGASFRSTREALS